MTEPRYAVPLSDLEHGDKEIDEPLPATWIAWALAESEAGPRGQEDGHITLTLTKTGKDIVVRGQLRAPVQMPCSRTLVSTEVDVDTEVFLLLAPGPSSGARAPKTRKKATERSSEARKRGQRKDSATEPEERELSTEEAAQDTYSGDSIVLDGYLREFVLLELPLFPLHPNSSPATTPPTSGPSDRVGDPRLAPLAALAGRLKKEKN